MRILVTGITGQVGGRGARLPAGRGTLIAAARPISPG
jgi:uncharacterized protein YbjT (DUF2867 family)